MLSVRDKVKERAVLYHVEGGVAGNTLELDLLNVFVKFNVVLYVAKIFVVVWKLLK